MKSGRRASANSVSIPAMRFDPTGHIVVVYRRAEAEAEGLTMLTEDGACLACGRAVRMTDLRDVLLAAGGVDLQPVCAQCAVARVPLRVVSPPTAGDGPYFVVVAAVTGDQP